MHGTSRKQSVDSFSFRPDSKHSLFTCDIFGKEHTLSAVSQRDFASSDESLYCQQDKTSVFYRKYYLAVDSCLRPIM